MDCTDLARLLPAFADGEFEDEDRTEVEIHLAHCETCRIEVASQTTFRAIVKARALTATAPASLRRRIEQDLARERLRAQAMRFVAYSAVAAGVVAVASTGYWMNHPSLQARHEQLFDDLVRYSRWGLQPDVTAVAGDDGMNSFLQPHLGFRVPVPHLPPGAPPLMGARLVSVHGHDAAEFTYGSDPRRRANLLVFSGDDVDLDGSERIGNRDVLLANHKGYSVAVWRRSGIVYSLVSDLDESDVRRMIQQVEDR